MKHLLSGITVIMYGDEQLAILEGHISLPLDARVQIGTSDYIIDNVRVSIREDDFDTYYDTHMAEEVGSKPSLIQ